MANPVTNANVVTFITTDPYGCGFAAIRQANPGQDAPLIAAANSTTGPGSGAVAGDTITAAALLDLIDGTEYNTMTSAQLQQLTTILTVGNVVIGEAPTQTKLNNLLANFPTSMNAVKTKYTRSGSAWERYFGKGLVADTATLDAARNSGSGNQF